MPEGFECEGVWGARGRGFQMAVRQPEGVVLHLTGQVAWSADEVIVGKGDAEAQTRQAFENIRRLLDAVGGRIEDVVSVTTYFTDPGQLPAIQKVRGEVFAPGREPVSTSVMVAGLGHPDFLVELTPVVVIPEARFSLPEQG